LVAFEKMYECTGGINTKLLWEGDGDHSNYGKIIK
jgi:hypothetical protein